AGRRPPRRPHRAPRGSGTHGRGGRGSAGEGVRARWRRARPRAAWILPWVLAVDPGARRAEVTNEDSGMIESRRAAHKRGGPIPPRQRRWNGRETLRCGPPPASSSGSLTTCPVEERPRRRDDDAETRSLIFCLTPSGVCTTFQRRGLASPDDEIHAPFP